jgi:hypothetical protein
MSERVDRDALIAAAKEAAQARGWITEWTTVAAMVDAVVVRVADAVEAEADRRKARVSSMIGHDLTHDPASSCYFRAAARLVRSFGGEQ